MAHSLEIVLMLLVRALQGYGAVLHLTQNEGVTQQTLSFNIPIDRKDLLENLVQVLGQSPVGTATLSTEFIKVSIEVDTGTLERVEIVDTFADAGFAQAADGSFCSGP